ncbi:hypothetical protein NHX12_029457 [Muraenolepis orangiensis]|uniref:C2H2-type domain-containing protein n=1 Tax=Muraenolepis orangiensis TaxID=630683 RepID=A0A9Q0EE49_9TELE|nr:hypothetical protein NHX12_029457 [Muraenolepis orangiensis]
MFFCVCIPMIPVEVLQHPAWREVSNRLAKEEPETPHITVKEEQEEVWISQEGGELKEEGPERPSSAVPVKRGDGGNPARSSLLEAEPRTCDSEPHIKPELQPLSCTLGLFTTAEPHVKEDPGEQNCAGSEQLVGGFVQARDSKMGVEKRLCCFVCELECISKAHLITHMRVHTGERPFACSVCGKTYTTKGSLNRHHLSIHRGERTFCCKFCASSFTFKSGLDRHVRVHTGERPYACSFCGLRFTQSGNLTTHINVHHRTTSVRSKMKA